LPIPPFQSNRRSFLLSTSALAVTTLLPEVLVAKDREGSAMQHQAEDATKTAFKIPDRDNLLKFNIDGSRRAFAGNTVICHLPVQSAMRDAVLALHADLANAPYRSRLGLTSTDSYYMTVFSGANDHDRAVTGWPSYVLQDASIDVCNRMVGARMKEAHLECELPLRVRVDQDHTLNYPTACTLRMIPADESEKVKLRSLRDQLAEVYGFRSRDLNRYEFHITLSYQLTPFSQAERAVYEEMLKPHLARISESCLSSRIRQPGILHLPGYVSLRSPKTHPLFMMAL